MLIPNEAHTVDFDDNRTTFNDGTDAGGFVLARNTVSDVVVFDNPLITPHNFVGHRSTSIVGIAFSLEAQADPLLGYDIDAIAATSVVQLPAPKVKTSQNITSLIIGHCALACIQG